MLVFSGVGYKKSLSQYLLFIEKNIWFPFLEITSMPSYTKILQQQEEKKKKWWMIKYV